jgi:integrase/recombinase XerD
MNLSLEKAIDAFRLANEAEALSPKTVTWYDANLRYFLKWIEHQENGTVMLESVTAIQIRSYLNELRTDRRSYLSHPFRKQLNKSVSPRTVQAYYSSISALFNWAVREELISTSPVKNITRPKTPKFLPDPFSESELRLLFSATKQFDDEKASRLNAIMMVLLDTGLRMTELLDAKIEDVDLEQGRIKIMGKGAKERFVYFGRNTKKCLWKYITQFRAEPYPQVKNLFLTQDGRPITQRRLASMLHEIGKKAHVENVHPHRWRRTAAIQFLRNSNGDIFALQKMLGHETLDMVRRYLDYSDEDLAKAHKAASPVDNLRIA